MKKRTIVVMMLVFVMILSTAACTEKPVDTQTNEEPAQSEQTVEATEPTEPAEPVNITFWYALSGSKGEVFQAMIDEFNASQDEVIVEGIFSGKYAETAQKVSAALTQPDTLPNGGVIPAGPAFTGANGNYVIKDMMEQSETFDMDDFYSGLWDYARYEDGDVCAIPYNISTPMLYYNADLLKEAGIENPPTTWEELKEQAVAIAALGDDIEGFDTADPVWIFKAFLMQNECGIIDTTTSTPLFDTPEGIETAEYWLSLVEEGAMPVGMHDISEDNFMAGLLGFYMGTSARIGTWYGNTTFELGAVALPKGKQYAVPIGGATIVLFPKSEAEDEATFKFIEYVTNTENLASFCAQTGYIPPRASVLETDMIQETMEAIPMYRTTFEQLEYASAYYHFDEMGMMDELIWYATEYIETKEKTPEEAMQYITESLLAEME